MLSTIFKFKDVQHTIKRTTFVGRWLFKSSVQEKWPGVFCVCFGEQLDPNRERTIDSSCSELPKNPPQFGFELGVESGVGL
jgi:hypothetical protein